MGWLANKRKNERLGFERSAEVNKKRANELFIRAGNLKPATIKELEAQHELKKFSANAYHDSAIFENMATRTGFPLSPKNLAKRLQISVEHSKNRAIIDANHARALAGIVPNGGAKSIAHANVKAKHADSEMKKSERLLRKANRRRIISRFLSDFIEGR